MCRMPRRRKSFSASPQRNISITSSALAQLPAAAAALPLPPAMSNKEEMLCRMYEMFPNLDPSLVEMVLSEYKEVEVVMDYLLELSTSAKGETLQQCSGFHKMASLLDGLHDSNQSSESLEFISEQKEDDKDDVCVDGTICDDLDTLLDETLYRYGLNSTEPLASEQLCEYSASTTKTLEIMPEHSTSDQNTPFQTDVEMDNPDALDLYTDSCDYNAGTFATLPSNGPETNEQLKPETDFSTTPDMIYNFETPVKQQPCTESTSATHSTVSIQSAPGASQIKWNPMASSFYPSNPQSSFIAPVADIPTPWMSIAGAKEPFRGTFYNPQVPPSHVWNVNHFPPNHWSTDIVNPINPYIPAARIGSQVSKKVSNFSGKVLVLLRGAPGSGKSTLARMLLEQNPSGIILSTDDYFLRNGQYQYDVNCLGEAHEWNHKRAKDAFEKTVSPIIIDNTNLQGWEMKPYVSMAMRYKYKVTFREPETWWKYKPKELERRNCHGIKKEKIKKMLEHFERVTVNSILNLSRPKASESADSSHVSKPADKSRQNSTLPSNGNGDDSCLSNIPIRREEHPSDVAAVIPCNIEDGIEIPQDVALLIVENANSDKESCVEEDIKSFNEMPLQAEESSSDSISVEKSVVDEPTPLISSDTTQLIERPELLSFVGDWPVEQTIGQRAPRNKKVRPRLKMYDDSVQQSNDSEKTMDCHMDQLDSELIEHEQLNDILKTADDIDFSAVNHDEENIIKLENQLLVSLSLMNEEIKSQEDITCDVMDIERDSIPLQEVVQDVTSVEEDGNIKGKSDKSNSMHSNSALTFPNSCASSIGTSENHKCESPEAIEQANPELCKFSQTEPQEFALAWRIEKKDFNIVDSIKVLTGKSSRFKSKSLDANAHDQELIPYRVMHHKSTSVEEEDIASLGNEDSFNILCKLFRSISFDDLKDLYERCNKDIVWATNVLLDSGEKIYKDEECQSEDCHVNEDYQPLETSKDSFHSNHDDKSMLTDQHNSLVSNESSLKAPTSVTFVNSMPVVVAEEFKTCNVLSSNEGNIPLDYQSIISSDLNSVIPGKDLLIDPIIAHKSWSSDLERETLDIPESSVHILAPSNSFRNSLELHLPSPNVFQRPDEPLCEEPKNTPAEIVQDQDTTKNNNSRSQSKDSLKFDYLELSLPPEFAFQLTELFGPVGIAPSSLTIEDCVVPIDLKLAEAIHKMWKKSIMERHKQEALSYQLQFEDNSENVILDNVIKGQEAQLHGGNLAGLQAEADMFPFMDQWNTRTVTVSLRKIMSEEMAFQAKEDLKPQSKKNCAIKMKEKQLLELFPQVEQKLLLDIFKENDYSLEKTEEFMSSILEADPVQNVVAQGVRQAVSSAVDKSKEKKVKADKENLSERSYQDLEYPDYDDFRAEAFLYRQKQQESYRKAAEAHHRGMKQVAAFYAQQGYLYGQKMKEENRRAAVQIFERANEYLLPENILDLHGLHVDEAMKHFRKVLQDKTEEFKQNGGKSYLLVITGRGNHSQGGVPRIKPAIADYLTNHDYRFQEKTAGVLRITLK